MANNSFGSAARQNVFPTRVAVSSNYDQVAVQFFCCGHNLAPWDADAQFGIANHVCRDPAGGRQGIKLLLQALNQARLMHGQRCEGFRHPQKWERLEDIHEAELCADAFGEVVSKFQCPQRMLRKINCHEDVLELPR